ncbi:GyrI-like domain-containing protein [Flavilitoribacter nigricans]|uniref:Uncharacterized protein n=1 Tax=Flavilitoribacter nigricans (strain ATCC 23147 / DSM 23189 / NBRC 102662 / NCIMB 1420 / SS-2) TaxID=1122177 RepID=A0A2D0N9C1_FLAN2|nr:GyrI-like domain-containing protein [Flavilitoribacter nigricans]PHN04739.1 hypothetical protein CRP01_19685 [Flavilitoribacter nigricans DSM 23189 = NBRC 102662]
MEKLDLKKRYAPYYSAARQPEIRQIEAARYISITGQGDPDGPEYAAKVQALFTVAYSLKFAFKQEGQDFVVPRLEGCWWFDEDAYGSVTMEEAPTRIPRSEWHWRMMIRMPEFVHAAALTVAIDEVIRKKALETARSIAWLETPPEKVVQMLHVGPFEREPESLRILQQFIEQRGFKKAGLHHEIYLSDIRRAAPESWRTILREPVS